MSLKLELRKRLLQDMIRVAKGSHPAIVLVVDPHTSKILSSCLRMYDIMEAGVLVLQNLLLVREKLPDLPALYFIDPTQECIEQVMKDFPAGGLTGAAAAAAKKSEAKCQYLDAHLFFTSHVPQAGINLIKNSPLIKKVRSFVELNVDFIAFESRVFHFDQPATIPRLYFPADHSQLSLTLSAISKPLVSLCITLNEWPLVRYAATGKSGLCKGLAMFFDSDMKKTVSQLSSWKINEQRERGTLLVVDRSVDPLAPLMHEFTFQAMVNDVLKVKDEIAYLPVSTVGANGLPKTASELQADRAAAELVLSEDDNLWLEFRHKHIGSVMREVTGKFKEFKGANKMAGLQQKSESGTVKEMIQAMKDMPEYKNMMKKYHKHMSLAQECMAKFDARQLQPVGELEQDMATGLDADGQSISMKDVKDRLVQLCQDSRVGVLDKLRLVMIYMISQGGMQDATRRELMKSVDVELQDAIRNLDALGVDLSSGGEKKKKSVSKERMEEIKQRNKHNELALMRYPPILQGIIEQMVAGRLNEDGFPYTSPPPPGSQSSASSGAARKGVSARKKNGADWKSGESSASASSSAQVPDGDDLRPRFFVFVLGGLAFSEMRCVYEVAEKTGANVYIGSTATITPREFIRDLSNLDPKAFNAAVEHSAANQQRMGAGGAAGSSMGSGSSMGASSAAATGSGLAARRGPIVDSDDSDDDEPLQMDRLKVSVR